MRVRPQQDQQAADPAHGAEIQRKLLATLKARAALAGATLIECAANDGTLELVLTKWHLTRAFRADQLDDLEATLGRMGTAR